VKSYTADQIRNVALVGHQHTGKTLLAEAILFATGAINRMGRVEDGNTTMDTAPEEIERQISIQAALAFCEAHNCKFNLIDTPGYEDFVGEALGALDVVEGVVAVVRGDAGKEVGSAKIWDRIREKKLPTIFCINKLDKENVSFDDTLASLRSAFGPKVLPLQLPLDEGVSFRGIVDILGEKAYEFSQDRKGAAKEIAVPAALKDRVSTMRREMFEMAAENDEALMEKYLEADSLTPEETVKGLGVGVGAADVFPVFCASAEKNIGTIQLLRGIADLFPSPVQRPLKLDGKGELKPVSPAPLAAKVFKNVSEAHVGDLLFLRCFQGTLSGGKDVYNSTRNTSDRLGQLFFLQGKHRVDTPDIHAGDLGAAVKLKSAHVGDSLGDKAHHITIPPTVYPAPSVFSAISAVTKGDEDKIGTGLNRLKEEDPTFEVKVDGEVHQTVISGQGELHLEILVGRLKRRYGVEVVLSKPRIPYRETIRKAAEAQGKYKKQTGGRGQYGDVWLKVEPLARGSSFEFVDAVVGGVVPGKFIPAVEKGVIGAMHEGVLAGYPVVDIKATIYDGSYHTVDSSEQAFKVAGSMAFKKAVTDARPVLLEPIMNIEIHVPDEYMGDVMGDLSGRRGKIQGMDPGAGSTVIKAQVPLAELYKYSTTLRSMTQGRGSHKRDFSHYEEVPHDQVEKIVAEAKKEKEQTHQEG
jgi:elongation factor G